MNEAKGIAATFAAHRGACVRWPDQAHPVWDLAVPDALVWRRAERARAALACQAAVWSNLSCTNAHLFLFPGETHEPEAPESWERQPSGSWMIPTHFDPSQPRPRYWVALREWVLCESRESPSRPSDLFRLTPAEAIHWARLEGVSVAVASRHDGLEWRVVVARLS